MSAEFKSFILEIAKLMERKRISKEVLKFIRDLHKKSLTEIIRDIISLQDADPRFGDILFNSTIIYALQKNDINLFKCLINELSRRIVKFSFDTYCWSRIGNNKSEERRGVSASFLFFADDLLQLVKNKKPFKELVTDYLSLLLENVFDISVADYICINYIPSAIKPIFYSMAMFSETIKESLIKSIKRNPRMVINLAKLFNLFAYDYLFLDIFYDMIDEDVYRELLSFQYLRTMLEKIISHISEKDFIEIISAVWKTLSGWSELFKNYALFSLIELFRYIILQNIDNIDYGKIYALIKEKPHGIEKILLSFIFLEALLRATLDAMLELDSKVITNIISFVRRNLLEIYKDLHLLDKQAREILLNIFFPESSRFYPRGYPKFLLSILFLTDKDKEIAFDFSDVRFTAYIFLLSLFYKKIDSEEIMRRIFSDLKINNMELIRKLLIKITEKDFSKEYLQEFMENVLFIRFYFKESHFRSAKSFSAIKCIDFMYNLRLDVTKLSASNIISLLLYAFHMMRLWYNKQRNSFLIFIPILIFIVFSFIFKLPQEEISRFINDVYNTISKQFQNKTLSRRHNLFISLICDAFRRIQCFEDSLLLFLALFYLLRLENIENMSIAFSMIYNIFVSKEDIDDMYIERVDQKVRELLRIRSGSFHLNDRKHLLAIYDAFKILFSFAFKNSNKVYQRVIKLNDALLQIAFGLLKKPNAYIKLLPYIISLGVLNLKFSPYIRNIMNLLTPNLRKRPFLEIFFIITHKRREIILNVMEAMKSLKTLHESFESIVLESALRVTNEFDNILINMIKQQSLNTITACELMISMPLRLFNELVKDKEIRKWIKNLPRTLRAPFHEMPEKASIILAYEILQS